MIMKNITLIFLLFISIFSQAQVAINPTGAAPHPSAMLDVNSTNKGLLLPRTTDPTANITAPAAGLMTYNTTTNTPNYYNGTNWQNVSGGPLPSNTFPNSVHFGDPDFTKYEGTGDQWDITNWTVPAGITKIWVEMWSGGGSGDKFNIIGFEQIGGESGGYLSAITPVISNETIAIWVAKGKKIKGNATGIASYIFRNTQNVSSIFTTGSNFGINNGASLIDFKQRNLGEGLIESNYIAFNDGTQQRSNYTNGGCTGGDTPYGGKGGKSGIVRISNELTGSPTPSVDGLLNYTVNSNGGFPGGGGGRGYYDFGAGGNGLIIIHY
jgi:hypothetical protein